MNFVDKKLGSRSELSDHESHFLALSASMTVTRLQVEGEEVGETAESVMMKLALTTTPPKRKKKSALEMAIQE